MNARPSTRSGIVLWTILVLAAFACGGFHRNEIVCEEAVVHVAECCPEVELRRINCDEDQDCASFTAHHPDLDDKLASCVKTTGCADMVAARICERIARASATPDVTGTTVNNRMAGVCP